MPQAVANDVNQQVASWSDGFASALGDSLQSVVLYGGLAKGEFMPEHSDVNVLIVLRTIDVQVLDRAAPLVRQGGFEFGLTAMLLTETDLRDSAAVFPIKFLDHVCYYSFLTHTPDKMIGIGKQKPFEALCLDT